MQHPGEDLSWCTEVQTLSWGVIVGVDDAVEIFRAECCDVGFAREEAAESSDSVFDAAFLPGRVRIAEEGEQSGLFVQAMMLGKLGSIVDGERSAQSLGQGLEPSGEDFGGGPGAPAGGLDDGGEARGALVEHQDGLSQPGRTA